MISSCDCPAADGIVFVVQNGQMESYFADDDEPGDAIESLEEQKCLSVIPPIPHGAAGF